MFVFARRLCAALLVTLATTPYACAASSDFAIVVTDGTPERGVLALRVESLLADTGLDADRVEVLAAPSAATLAAAMQRVTDEGPTTDLYVFLLADAAPGGNPVLETGSGQISGSLVRTSLDALSPALGGRQVVLLDGHYAGQFLSGLANTQLENGERLLLGPATHKRTPEYWDDRTRGYASAWSSAELRRGGGTFLALHGEAVKVAGVTASDAYLDANGNGVRNELKDQVLAGNGVLRYDGVVPGGPGGPDRAIVIAANLPTDPLAPAFNNAGISVVRTLKSLSYADDSVRWLSGATGTPATGNPDAAPGRYPVLDAIFAAGNAQDVVVYLNGHGSQDRIRINDTQSLLYTDLSQWIIGLQAQVSGRVTLIVDACYSGALIDVFAGVAATSLARNPLAFPRGYPVIVASSRASQLSYFENAGASSFTTFLAARVGLGQRLADAFPFVDRAVAVGGKQHVEIDGDGDGIANEAEDHVAARYGLAATVVVQLPPPDGGISPPPGGCNCM